MGTPTSEDEHSRSHPCSSSSPLSSPVDLELSDNSVLDEIRQVEDQDKVSPTVQAGQAAQSMAYHESEGVENARTSHSIPRDTTNGEDELAGEPPPQTSAEHDVSSDASERKAVNTTERSSGRAPTRRMPDRQKKIIIKQPPKKTQRKAVWTAERLLTDPKSPLAKADLRSILANPMTWDILDSHTRADILALFPYQHMVLDAGTENARPNIAAMMNDDTFRGDCASYTEHLIQGHHDHGWLSGAYKAHHRRKTGEFDDFLIQKFSSDWGVELPENFRPRRTSASQENKDEGGPIEKD